MISLFGKSSLTPNGTNTKPNSKATTLWLPRGGVKPHNANSRSNGTTMPEPTDDWRLDAKCTQVDPDIFFPAKGDNTSHDKAVKVCSGCPVQRQCALLALDNRERHGIWAGRNTQDLRREARREGVIALPPLKVRGKPKETCGCDGPLLEDKCPDHYAEWLEKAIARIPAS